MDNVFNVLASSRIQAATVKPRRAAEQPGDHDQQVAGARQARGKEDPAPETAGEAAFPHGHQRVLGKQLASLDFLVE